MEGLMRYRIFFVLVVLLSLSSIPAQAQTTERCFVETGFCISGRIRRYWEQHGGLEIFGYPITNVRIQTNGDTWTGPTQWFERDRLEDHANEQLGVLAGRLGAELLVRKGIPWTFNPNTAPPRADCRRFVETGYRICGSYLRYWEQHGGLERFGYPISNEQILDATVRTFRSEQYFERRRMELRGSEAVGHPAVLLGLLGNELGTGAANWPISIQTVDKRSTPETVTLKNVSTTAITLTGWAIVSERRQQRHCCLQGMMLAPGETRSFPHEGPDPVFEDALRNDAALYDADHQLISYWIDW
jgi:hypothetical protein